MYRRFALKHIATLTVVAALSQYAFAQTPKMVATPQPTEQSKKVEVLEFFSYACGHCRDFDPLLEKWKKNLPDDAYFVRIPVGFGRPAWANLSRLYYTLEALGALDRLHAAAFVALHDKGVRLDQNEVQPDWAASNGIDKAKFIETSKSFSVQSKVQRAEQIIRNYKVDAVPMLVINGKYIAEGSDFPSILQSADSLIQLARKDQGR